MGRGTKFSEEIPVSITDVQYNPDIINGLLIDLQSQVDAKCVLITKDIDFMVTSIRQAFHLELIKLPTQVKCMPINRFKTEFDDNLNAVKRGAVGMTMLNASKIPTEKLQESSGSPIISGVLQTPAGKLGKQVDETPITRSKRAAREGEMILSVNGSPLGEFSTVIKIPKENNSIVPPTPAGNKISMKLDSGEDVDIDNVETLSEKSKAEALQKMQNMMINMQQMMKRLEGNKV